MTVYFGSEPHLYCANYRTLRLAIDDEGRGFAVFARSTTHPNEWSHLRKTDPLYALCKIWSTSFKNSLSLQEFLDGAKNGG